MDKLKLISAKITVRQYRAIKNFAHVKDVSFASILRMMIEDWINSSKLK